MDLVRTSQQWEVRAASKQRKDGQCFDSVKVFVRWTLRGHWLHTVRSSHMHSQKCVSCDSVPVKRVDYKRSAPFVQCSFRERR